MFVNKDDYIKPEIMIIKFGSEDIITSSRYYDPDKIDPFNDDWYQN